ncbi:GntR family transcriptional regulator [Roseococcus sp. YIM B11640]|uniref:GntR family transcriptional regulator n=1 Tax=Roseococcus sp. YIM B11640 TaxID=3133973 RepID=UPI003C7DACF7
MSEAPLKHRTLASAVLDRVREEILLGRHPAGTQLRQDALAQAYGVSRIPVREALLQLEAEGFVRIVPHKGAIVSPISRDDLNDVFDLRTMLEPRLFASAIPLLTPGDFAEIDALHESFAAAIAARDVVQWGLINADFHARLYAPAPLPRTQAIVAALLQTSDRYTRLQLSTPVAMERAQREHAELIALARKGHIERASKRLATHIETVRADLLKVLARG